MNRALPRPVGADAVVVTGAGVISTFGASIDEFARGLYSGSSAQSVDDTFAGAVTASIRGFEPQQWLGSKGIRGLDRTARLVCVATQMALASFAASTADARNGRERVGLVCGTMFSSLGSITAFDWRGLTDGPYYVNPAQFPNTVLNSPAGQAAIRYGLKGVNATISAGMISGLYALDYAAQFLRLGRAERLLAGGCEELSQETFFGFQKAGHLSASGQARPFASDRDGIVLGEGCALLVLERLDALSGEGAKPWVELCGFGSVNNVRHGERGEGMAQAMDLALEATGIGPEEVSCIVASANGSRIGDEMETWALEKVFGDRLQQIPVLAPKAAYGELLGAAGPFSVLAAAECLARQSAPPTANTIESSTRIRLSRQAQPCAGDYALIDGISCEGNSCCLLVRRCAN